jgi:hypothetical protein
MDRYLIISPHSVQECTNALKQLLYIGYLTHFDWGCLDGDHTGYAVIEASSVKEAIMAIPPLQRQTARVIRLNKFTPEEIKSMH